MTKDTGRSTKPKSRYPWHTAPDWANWAAKDMNNRCHWYECKPDRWDDGSDYQWYRTGPRAENDRFAVIHELRLSVPWRKSLEAHPRVAVREAQRLRQVKRRARKVITKAAIRRMLRDAYENGWQRGHKGEDFCPYRETGTWYVQKKRWEL